MPRSGFDWEKRMFSKIWHSRGFWAFICVAALAAGSVLLLRVLHPGKAKTATQELLPANDDGVRQVVANTFGHAVTLEGTGPEYVTGDFNGDGSEDVAVLVRPASGKLNDLNSDAANWIIRDPQKVFLPGPHERVIKLDAHPKAEKVQAGDALIAMIHGVGRDGWRGAMTQQIFLLRNVADSMPVADHPPQLPWQPHSATVIRETAGHTQGYVYWVGTMYAWHPLESQAAAP